MSRKHLEPIPPGEILLEEFMKPLKISINRLARDIDVPPNRISAIVRGKRAITADTALRLGKYFAVSPEIWLDLQSDYELRVLATDGPDRAAHPDNRRLTRDAPLRRRRTEWPRIEPRIRTIAA